MDIHKNAEYRRSEEVMGLWWRMPFVACAPLVQLPLGRRISQESLVVFPVEEAQFRFILCAVNKTPMERVSSVR